MASLRIKKKLSNLVKCGADLPNGHTKGGQRHIFISLQILVSQRVLGPINGKKNLVKILL